MVAANSQSCPSAPSRGTKRLTNTPFQRVVDDRIARDLQQLARFTVDPSSVTVCIMYDRTKLSTPPPELMRLTEASSAFSTDDADYITPLLQLRSQCVVRCRSSSTETKLDMTSPLPCQRLSNGSLHQCCRSKPSGESRDGACHPLGPGP